MSSIVSISQFVAVIAAGVYALVPSTATVNTELQTAAPDASTIANSPEVGGDGVPGWNIDYDSSSISFTGEQAGAKFTGTWTQWQGDIRFDPQNLSASTVKVEIGTGFADTGDSERDGTMQNSDWFDSTNYPSATFTAASFTRSATGYIADGSLNIKGHGSPVQFTFNIELDNTRVMLIGNARIDRLAHRVGTGEWLDTSWVGQFVDVNVRVVAQIPDST